MPRCIREEQPGLRVLALSIDDTVMSPIARETAARHVAAEQAIPLICVICVICVIGVVGMHQLGYASFDR